MEAISKYANGVDLVDLYDEDSWPEDMAQNTQICEENPILIGDSVPLALPMSYQKHTVFTRDPDETLFPDFDMVMQSLKPTTNSIAENPGKFFAHAEQQQVQQHNENSTQQINTCKNVHRAVNSVNQSEIYQGVQLFKVERFREDELTRKRRRLAQGSWYAAQALETPVEQKREGNRLAAEPNKEDTLSERTLTEESGIEMARRQRPAHEQGNRFHASGLMEEEKQVAQKPGTVQIESGVPETLLRHADMSAQGSHESSSKTITESNQAWGQSMSSSSSSAVVSDVKKDVSRHGKQFADKKKQGK